ncbi:MAG: hypothetical protein MI919_33910 [Holophagales bacterium]|nr:hypothetical protein [Holophagales bacterium]
MLYDEMLGEPSNVLLATIVRADTTRYEAMPRAFWLDCLPVPYAGREGVMAQSAGQRFEV